MARSSKEADLAYNRAWRSAHRKKYNEQQRRYRREHPESYSQYYRKYQLRSYYGITLEDYDRILSAQNGVCAICHAGISNNGNGSRYLNVDHDHKLNVVRGLLCRRCNVLLGYLESDPAWLQAARVYLAKYQCVEEAV